MKEQEWKFWQKAFLAALAGSSSLECPEWHPAIEASEIADEALKIWQQQKAEMEADADLARHEQAQETLNALMRLDARRASADGQTGGEV